MSKKASKKRAIKKAAAKRPVKKKAAGGRLRATFFREFKALIAKHDMKNMMLATMSDAVAGGEEDCPPGTTRKRVTFKDQFGNTIIKDICV